MLQDLSDAGAYLCQDLPLGLESSHSLMVLGLQHRHGCFVPLVLRFHARLTAVIAALHDLDTPCDEGVLSQSDEPRDHNPSDIRPGRLVCGLQRDNRSLGQLFVFIHDGMKDIRSWCLDQTEASIQSGRIVTDIRKIADEPRRPKSDRTKRL